MKNVKQLLRKIDENIDMEKDLRRMARIVI